MEEQIAKALAEHWVLVVAGIWAWRWWEKEKAARREADRARREEEREERAEQRDATREVVRDELTKHVAEEAQQFSVFRDDVKRELSSVADLVRQHEVRIRDLEIVKR